MKTARNSLKGYTFQNYIFTLLLAKMDTEREIVKIISEATDTKNFDDIYVKLFSGKQYRLQVKNYKDIKLTDIQVDTTAHVVKIKSNRDEYDPADNNIFVLNADFEASCDKDFLGIPAIQMDDIMIVPLSEENVADRIDGLYQHESRELQIIQFGYKLISSGKFDVTKTDLPPIITISTDLDRETVVVRGVPEDFPTGITHIEGKPGVGKSHYVNEIISAHPDSIIYRFWIAAQDPELNERLRYEVFLEQLGLLAFQSPKSFTDDELIEQLCRINKLVIIDGLDHVENYNPKELGKFIEFFDKLNRRPIKVIILSRPMKASFAWKKTEQLPDWTRDETVWYLAKAHSIKDLRIQRSIYNISKGYPIVTCFVAEHYLKYHELSVDKPIDDIYGYYEKLISDVETKSVLGIFAVNNSFFTFEEIKGFCDSFPYYYKVIEEFKNGYPYLFEIRANRISLVHDSFNTFLRQQEESNDWITIINQKVYEKLSAGEVEYMARLSSFHLDESQICDIIKLYSNFDIFEKLMLSTVDYNSIATFYEQLRRLLDTRPDVLDIYQYYSFALIFQIVTRNDLVGYEDLIFQILEYLKNHGGVENQIFSSGIIWQVYLACEKDQPESIKRYLKNTMYGDVQVNSAYKSINEEIQFFDCLDNELNTKEKNICRQGSILSIVKEKAPKGSEDVVQAVLSFLRLANHENRTVDIYNINYVWSMYAQYKDYSVCTIDTAMCTYERAGLIDESDSLEIICRLMRQSEKGIRYLLESYINLKGPKYVRRLVKSGKIFSIESQLDFFEINPENINCLPKETIEMRFAKLMRSYSGLEYMDVNAVRNILRSDYATLICDALNSCGKTVKGGLDDEEINILDKYGVEYICENNTDVKRKYSPFRDGCIRREDFDYIKENHISIIECSRYAGGWYDCLPYVDLYERFDIQVVKELYLSIIHNALFAKVIRGEHIGNWMNITGNIPAFLEKYEVEDIDWERLFKQMLRFMDLSIIYYPAKLKG